MDKLSWIVEAEKFTGLHEIKGAANESKILNFWQAIKMGGIKDDETPWCAAFVGACLENAGIKSTRTGWARSYMTWGIALSKPVYGCIVVFSRPGGGGHVGFVIGMDKTGRLLVLGGNQGDMVKVSPFDLTRVIAYRWPSTINFPMVALSASDNNEMSSTNEA
jgi:uncharacterized protein (TIGR02594 family)